MLFGSLDDLVRRFETRLKRPTQYSKLAAQDLSMSLSLDTDLLSEQDRKGFWRDAVCAPYMHSTPTFRSEGAFRGRHDMRLCGDTILMESVTTEYAVARGRSEISRSPSETAVLMRQRSGAWRFQQNGREASLNVGDMVLLDSASPMAGDMARSGGLQCIVMPRAAITRRLGQMETSVARPLAAASAQGALLNDYCDMIYRSADGLDATHHVWLERGLHDLVAMAFGAPLDSLETGPATLRSVRRLALLNHIDEHYGDANMSAATAAGRLGISERYLHRLLEESGSSFRQTVMRRRLDQVRRLLLDPGQAHRSIADIAFSCGFGDLSGFNRAFKAAFSITPRALRLETPLIPGLAGLSDPGDPD